MPGKEGQITAVELFLTGKACTKLRTLSVKARQRGFLDEGLSRGPGTVTFRVGAANIAALQLECNQVTMKLRPSGVYYEFV